MPEVTALDRARAEFTRRTGRGCGTAVAGRPARPTAGPAGTGPGTGPDGPEPVRPDASSGSTRTRCRRHRRLAPLGTSFAPHSHFVQLARRDRDPLVVLNNSYGGLCFPFTRFTHCFENDGDGSGAGEGMSAGLRETLRGWQPPDAVFAEITAGVRHHQPQPARPAAPTTRSSVPARAAPSPPRAGSTWTTSTRSTTTADRPAGAALAAARPRGRPALPGLPRPDGAAGGAAHPAAVLADLAGVRRTCGAACPDGPATDGVTVRPRVRYRSLVLHRAVLDRSARRLPVREPGAGRSRSTSCAGSAGARPRPAGPGLRHRARGERRRRRGEREGAGSAENGESAAGGRVGAVFGGSKPPTSTSTARCR